MKWRAVGEMVDKLRIIPRVLLGLYTWQAYVVAKWAMGLTDLTVAQGMFVSTMYGVAPLLLNFYMQNGTDWDKPATATATTTVTTSQTQAQPA